MSQPTDQQPSPTKRPRSARGTKNSTEKHLAATDNKSVIQPVAASEASSRAQTSESPVGEKWGEFPTIERQVELKKTLEAWNQEQDHGDRPSPFAGWLYSDFELTGADVYWLVVLAAGKGDVDVGSKKLLEDPFTDPPNLHLEGANLRGAHLEGASLSGLYLEGASLINAHLEGVDLGGADLEGVNLRGAHLEGVNLRGAHLEGANLSEAHLEGAYLEQADLKGVDLSEAHLEGADLGEAHLEGADLGEAHLEGANLSHASLMNHVRIIGATFDVKTQLADAHLDATIRVADVLWNGAPLIRVDWEQVPRLGDEAQANETLTENLGEGLETPVERRKNPIERLNHYQAAARAYLQLAIALRGQGIAEAADRFTYRAQIMQRKALWWQLRSRKFSTLGSYLFSLFLAVLTGYGFRMWRIIAAYTLLILAFAGAYWSLDLQTPHIYTFWQALILSVTAFHGRVFSNPFLLTEPQIVVTAIEAIFGLVIEGVFIAMLTQRFFNR